MYFCVKCGKEIEEGVFCSSCTPSHSSPEAVNLKVCPCGRYSWHNKWSKHESPEAYLRKVLKKKFNLETEPVIVGEQKSKLVLEADNQKYDIMIMKCPKCELKHSAYFEGILQLRYPKGIEARLKKLIQEQVNSWASRQIFITKEEAVKDGLNLYITNKKAIGIFATKLNRRFGAKLKKSANLFSRNKQTSKDIYRLTVLVQFPHFFEGDVVFVNRKLAKVIQLRRQIKALDLRTAKTFGFVYKEDIPIIPKQKLVLSRDKPVIAVLHPDNYEEIELTNSKLLKPSKEMQVVFYEKKYYGVL